MSVAYGVSDTMLTAKGSQGHRPGGKQMAPKTKTATKPRIPLSRERVLLAAVAFADESGIAALSMRKLGDALGVEAMSLYNHVANKDELLDGMVDLVFSEIDLPSGGD